MHTHKFALKRRAARRVNPKLKGGGLLAARRFKGGLTRGGGLGLTPFIVIFHIMQLTPQKLNAEWKNRTGTEGASVLGIYIYTYIYIYIYIFIHLYVLLGLYICLYIHLFVKYVFIFMYYYLYLYIPIRFIRFICMSVLMFIYIYIYLFIYSYTDIYLDIHIYICRSIFIFSCL